MRRIWIQSHNDSGIAEAGPAGDNADAGTLGCRDDRLFIFPGYPPNPARNNGADLEPIPISPVRGQQWPGMQVQLSNGWMRTSYGLKLSYDTYLRMLTAENGRAGVRTLPGQGRQVMQGPGPYQAQQVMVRNAGSQPRAPGGTGMIAPNVDLSTRRAFN